MSQNYEWGYDPEHAIFPRAFEWTIIAVLLHMEPADGGEPRLDLVLRRGKERRILRFWSPTDLEIERGGPRQTGGLIFYDVSARGLEGIGVRVDDFELSPGRVHFLARAVEEVAAPIG